MVDNRPLGFKLDELRNARKETLGQVCKNIAKDQKKYMKKLSVSALQRLENSNDSVNAGYKEIRALALYYGVSADYLLGFTDSKTYRHYDVDTLGLLDDAIDILRSRKLNNRLISELISHPDLPNLLSAIEVYIDRKVIPQMNTMNAMYKLAENILRENFDITDNDKTMALLKESTVDEDEYLRYRISERFNVIMKSLFEAHKQEIKDTAHAEMLHQIREGFDTYFAYKDNPEQAKMILLGKQLGMDLSQLDESAINAMMKAFSSSDKMKQAKNAPNKELVLSAVQQHFKG